MRQTRAQGIKAGRTTYSFGGTDARDGQRLWSSKIVADSSDNSGYGGNNDDPCTAETDSGFLNLATDLQIASTGNQVLLVSENLGVLLVDVKTGSLHKLGGTAGAILGSNVAVLNSSGEVSTIYSATTARRVGVTSSPTISSCLSAIGNGYGCAVAGGSSGPIVLTNVGQALVSASVPAGRTIWRRSGDGLTTVESGGSVWLEHCKAYGCSGVTAASLRTGRTVWRTRFDYCGATDGKVFVLAHGDLATLDVATGKQLTYTTAVECPVVVPGALVETSTGGVTVTPV
jgi:hypothetical protein